MCNFMSAIVLPDGDVYCRPEVTDSHEDLICALGLEDSGGEEFARVEFVPQDNNYLDVDTYKLKLDQHIRPSWFDDKLEEKTVARLRVVIERAIERGKGGFALGELVIGKDCNIVLRSARAFVFDSSKVKAYDSSKVTAHHYSKVTAYDSSEVTACGSSKVMAYDSSEVKAHGSSKVTAYGSSKVMAYDSSKVMAYDSSKVMAYDSSEVTAYDSSEVTENK